MMSFIYIISSLLLFIVAILVKKSEEKLEITKTITIILTLTLAYNTLCAYMLNLVNIPITLLNLSIINVIFSICISIKIIKDKKIQKYAISKTNVIVIIILIIVVGIITNINFEGVSRIRYVSMDAREHYKAAREFSENTALSNKQVENNTVNGTFMPMAYVNDGIIFKIFEPYIGTVGLYKVYILLEAFIYLLTGIMFYILIEKYVNKTNGKIIAIIFSIIYILGYPLNAWISGFHYLIIGILFVEAIIYIVSQIGKLGYELIIMFLLNFGLILSYSLFCPFVYLAEFIYFIYKYKKGEDKIKLFLFVLIALILPGMIGVAYLILPPLGNVTQGITLEGWLYKNLWSNFILFVPFSVYAIYKSIKNKEFTFDNILYILLVIYMFVLFVGTKLGKCSQYYFGKNYFILWIMLIYLSIKGMSEFLKEKSGKYIVNICTIIYLIIFGLSIYYQDTYVRQEANDSFKATMEIFTFNNTMIHAKNAAFVTNEELQLFKETEKVIKEKWREEDKILFVTDPTQERWLQSLTGYKNILFDNKDYAIKNLKEENYKYIVTFENRNTYQNVKEYINEENMKIVYENSIGKIYEKKEE